MKDPIWSLMGMLFKSHPWHGVPIGDACPDQITAYIEIVPTDTVKYELDKYSGHLKVDRPQGFSNICPTLYGLVPQTLCADRIAEYSMEKSGKEGLVGDSDPLDICVLTERDLSHGNVFLQAIPIGGFRMIDQGEADDKILAVLLGDATYGHMRDISEVPDGVVQRLKHYFLTYKQVPGDGLPRSCEITHTYGREEAHEVIRRSHADYNEIFSGLENLLTDMLRGTASA
jgi:inorganic pyrophosphatase